ncbi:hypothetical protein OnM2_097002 [Erysiphe neolycopersici]|uniref:Uncharacterized protein n=1 Tax=Erysiphe neolycopersici TaxID=212602 RepID=A0A420HAQ2_9PEZI|nr:hypothetical protein OnM2_097002 [Erysiphe neolycopersici]
MSLIDWNFLLEVFPTIEFQTMKTEMKIRGFGSHRHDASQFVILDFYLPATKGIIAQLSREIHIVNELEARVLLGMDVIHSKGRKKNRHLCSREFPIPPQSLAFVFGSGKKGDILSLADRDIMFEPIRQNDFTTITQLDSREYKAIMFKNPTDSGYRPAESQTRKYCRLRRTNNNNCHIDEYLSPRGNSSEYPLLRKTIVN